MEQKYLCIVCKKQIPASEVYEYRGIFHCVEHSDEAEKLRDAERNAIIKEDEAFNSIALRLDLSSDNPVGRENRKIFKTQISFRSKESTRRRRYERPD